MKQKLLTRMLLIFALFTFVGCHRYIRWFKKGVDQGCKIETCYACVQPYIRAARVYDQITTLGLFDAMWLSDHVLQSYVCAYAAKHGFDQKKRARFLAQQREEHSPYISFYLLAVVYGDSGVLLTDENPLWTVQLKVGDNYFHPAKIKIVEVPHEYYYFFGKRMTVFKKQYLLQFNKFDAHNVPLINASTQSFELVLRRVGRKTNMVWCLDGQQRVVNRHSLSEDIMAYDLNLNM